MSVAALLQRLGRAGHGPGLVSRMTIYPRTAQETLFCALTAKAAADEAIESIHAPEMCLDILCQHLVSMATAGEWRVSEATRILSGAYAYRMLTEERVEQALRLLAGDYEHALDRPVRARLIYDRIHGTFSGDGYTRMLALSSGGTIPDRGWYTVQLADGTKLGELDEEYVFEARIGDKFMLGAFPWVILDITHDRVLVERTTPSGAASPFWRGDSAMRAFETGCRFGALLRNLDDCARSESRARLKSALMDMCLSENAANAASRVILEQIAACGALATDRHILLEHFQDESNEFQMMVHSPFGAKVNSALGMLLAREAALVTGADARFYSDDDGVLIHMIGATPVPSGLFARLSPETAPDIVRQLLPASPMFSIVFRQNAQRAMLMGARSGRRQPLWVQRLRASQTLADALKTNAHPLVDDTLRECLRDYLDMNALSFVLNEIRAGRIAVTELARETPSPLSLNLRRQTQADLMYETVIPSVASKARPEAKPTLAPDPSAVSEAYRAKPAETPEEAHAFLMTTGDLAAGESLIPIEVLEALAADGRCAYIEPGLWIAAEHEESYRQALLDGDDAALLPIARRLSRYRGAISAELLAERYLLPPARAERIVSRLAEAGEILPFADGYLHRDIYASAQYKTVSARRKGIKTVPCASYAAALFSRMREGGVGEEATASALRSLTGEMHPAEAWEQAYLPARVPRYRQRYLDSALARGEVFYKVNADTRVRAAFYLPEDETETPVALPEALTGEELAVFNRLAVRGASFARALSDCAPKTGVVKALLSLLRKGLVRSDSFAPVRLLIAGEKASLKTGIRSSVQAVDAGRWEIQRQLRANTPEQTLERLFERRLIAAKETAREESWPALLTALRRLEYAGLVRRGYFVEGMSGAQFVREQDFASVTYLLSAPADEYVCLLASDPAVPMGKLLRREEGAAFARVPSTAVVFYKGMPAIAMEKQGETLRVWDEDRLSPALLAFANAFRSGSIFPSLTRITIKSFPENAKKALEDAGFLPDFLYYSLFRS